MDTKQKEFFDLRIPMPWGYVVGRWYGNRQVRPILALHGWLDNMGTWNTIIPLLPDHIGILCIDLPGHGLSPKLPRGIVYHAVDYVCVILRIMEEYQWQKVSIMSHSMSSMISFIFAALYPDQLDMLISIDIVKTRYRKPSSQIDYIRTNIEKYCVEDDRLQLANMMEPPAYTREQLLQVMYEGSAKSVALENCHHILERNVTKSTKYPDKYYFSRDGRVKYFFEFTTSPPFAAELARKIHNVPFCVIKGSQSNYIDEQSTEVIEILRENNPHFELHEVEGSHHVHLNNPVPCAAIINPFINRNRPPLVESWSLKESQLAAAAAVTNDQADDKLRNFVGVHDSTKNSNEQPMAGNTPIVVNDDNGNKFKVLTESFTGHDAADSQNQLNGKFKEIRFMVPWGHVSGRWYGNRQVRPILAIHGWMDNLGTWDPLIPLLPQHIGYLCIDLPGHGRSSKYPPGMVYHGIDYVHIIIRIMKEYQWQKVSLMGHSMGALACFYYASLYPQTVDLLIQVEGLKQPFRSTKYILRSIHLMEKLIEENQRLDNIQFKEPPSYAYHEMEELLHKGSGKSVYLENCKYLLNRSITPSRLYPDKYYFSRDGRLKYYVEFSGEFGLTMEMARSVKNVNISIVRGTKAPYNNDHKSKELLRLLSENNVTLEVHDIEEGGTHHVHLNNPIETAEAIGSFIMKHRPAALDKWSVDSNGADNQTYYIDIKSKM